jgi:hypothetical protein
MGDHGCCAWQVSQYICRMMIEDPQQAADHQLPYDTVPAEVAVRSDRRNRKALRCLLGIAA